MTELRCKAAAKINLTLDVLDRRNDGYHNIESIMQSVSLCDIITLRLSSGSGEIKVNCFGKVCGEENTAYRAIYEFMKSYGQKFDAYVDIEKHIPQAAGLGGGSADAAAVLLMLNTAYGPINESDLLSAAVNIGADVPFCISGGTAVAEGIGDKIAPLKYIGDYYVVIVKSGEKNSTGWMYNMIDQMKNIRTSFTQDYLKKYGIWGLAGAANCVGNIFSRLYTEYENAASKMQEFSPIAVSLSGAGPSIYGIFESKSLAESCFEYYKNTSSQAYICKTCESGIEII